MFAAFLWCFPVFFFMSLFSLAAFCVLFVGVFRIRTLLEEVLRLCTCSFFLTNLKTGPVPRGVAGRGYS